MKLYIPILLTTTCCALISASGYDGIDGLRIGEVPPRPPPPPTCEDAAHIGHVSQFRSNDNRGNFKFGYDESHASGGSSRKDEGLEGGVRFGSYSLSDADGRHRAVNYLADHTGFHAIISSNEPGVEPIDPADVYIHKEPDYAPYHHHHHTTGARARPSSAGQGYESSQGTVEVGYGAAAAAGQEVRDRVYPAPSDIRYSFRSTDQIPLQQSAAHQATFASSQYYEHSISPNYVQQDSRHHMVCIQLPLLPPPHK